MTKKALITAAATGIGAVVAIRAKAAGYDVTICDIDLEKGEQQGRAKWCLSSAIWQKKRT